MSQFASAFPSAHRSPAVEECLGENLGNTRLNYNGKNVSFCLKNATPLFSMKNHAPEESMYRWLAFNNL